MKQQEMKLSLSTLLVLAMTAVVPLSVATGFSNFERPRQLVLVVLAAAALIAWAVGLVRGRKVSVSSPGTVALGGAFVTTVVASLGWSGLLEFGALSVVVWVSLAAVFLILVAPVGRAPKFLDWVTAVGAGTIGTGGMGLYELFGGQGLVPVWEPAGVAGGFDSMAFATAYYMVAVVLLIGAVALSRGARRWFVAAALLVGSLHLGLVIEPVALGVLLAAMVVVAAGMWLAGAIEWSTTTARVAGLSALVAAVVVGGWMMFDRPDNPRAADDLPRLSSSSDFDDEIAQRPRSSWWYFAADRMESYPDHRFRSYLNNVTRGLWEQQPVIGHGAGGWWLSQTDVVDVSDPEIDAMFERYPAFKSPHSDYSRIAVEQGALGLLLFVLWMLGVVTAIAGGVRRIDAEDGDEDGVVMWSLATAFVVGAAAMAFVPFLELASSAVVWVGAAALAVATAAQRQGTDGWLTVVTPAEGKPLVRYAVAALAVVVAVAMVVPAALNAKASLERGWADHLMLRANHVEAISLYESAHETYPAHADVLYNIAVAHRMLGEPKQGREAVEQAIDMRPYDARFHVYLGELEMKEDRGRLAVEHGVEAVRTGPRYLKAYQLYTAALQRRAQFTRTVEVFEELLEMELPSRDRQVFQLQLAALHGTYLDDPETSLEYYKKARDVMSAGQERARVDDRIEELEKRLQREELEEKGLPVPPELQPEIEDPHDHHHHHHH